MPFSGTEIDALASKKDANAIQYMLENDPKSSDTVLCVESNEAYKTKANTVAKTVIKIRKMLGVKMLLMISHHQPRYHPLLPQPSTSASRNTFSTSVGSTNVQEG